MKLLKRRTFIRLTFRPSWIHTNHFRLSPPRAVCCNLMDVHQSEVDLTEPVPAFGEAGTAASGCQVTRHDDALSLAPPLNFGLIRTEAVSRRGLTLLWRRRPSEIPSHAQQEAKRSRRILGCWELWEAAAQQGEWLLYCWSWWSIKIFHVEDKGEGWPS